MHVLRLAGWGHARFAAGELGGQAAARGADVHVCVWGAGGMHVLRLEGWGIHVLRLGGQEAGGAGGTHVLRRRHARFAAGQAMQEKG